MADNFETVSERILQRWLELNPGTGRYLGLHEYDGKVADWSSDGLIRRVSWAQQELASLQQLDRMPLI